MPRRTFARSIALALAAAIAPALAAGPLDLRRVAADSDWVLHLDAEALRGSRLERLIFGHGPALGIDLDGLEELRDATGFDLRRDLHGATLFGRGDREEGEDGTLVAETTDAIEAALERLAEIPEVDARRETIGGRPGWRFAGEDDEASSWLVVLPHGDRGRRLVVSASDRYLVDQAARLLEGAAPALGPARPAWMIGEAPGPGTILYGAAGKLRAVPGDVSRLVELADAGAVEFVERDGRLRARISVLAERAEKAADLRDVMRGLVALGRLLLPADDPDLDFLRDLLDGVEPSSEGRRIDLAASIDLDAVLAELDREAAGDEAERDDDA